jgi:hypothetical protein
MIGYPVTVVLNGHQITFADPAQLSGSYDLVFNSNVRHAVIQQDPSRLRANWRGLIVGDGEVWFAIEDSSNKFKVTAINP